jgi:CRP-like cAMP-binding protein
LHSSKKIGNQLLDAFSPAAFERLRPHLEPYELILAAEIHDPGDMAEHVYFPISGLISVVATMNDGASVEIGVAGREGMFGVAAILGDDTPSQRAMVQLPGSALRLKTPRFRQEMKADPAMQATLLRYAQATLSAAGQSAACNRLHMLEQRCARWLLTAHDRAADDTFPLTHEFLAMMLGVRRPGVTLAARSLRKGGLIAYSHGSMSVLDRRGLEAASCECYRAIQDEFDRLLGPSDKPGPDDLRGQVLERRH